MDRLMLAVLLLAVPLQYYFLGFSLPKFLTGLTSRVNPIDSDDWFPTWIGVVVWLTEALFGVDSRTLGEVLNYAPRSSEGDVLLKIERPEEMLYRVGDVVQHTTEGLRGVVIYWDIEVSENEDKIVLSYMYTVLLDESDDERAHSDYGESVTAQFFQQDIQKITGHMTSSQDLHLYFEMFDGERFWPKKWLRKVYPNG